MTSFSEIEKKIIPGKVGGWRPNSGRKPGFVGFWAGKKRPGMKWEHLKEYHKRGDENYFAKMKYKGADHANWKGDKVGYYALHSWVVREKGKPETCEHCGKIEKRPRYIQWANKSGKYLRDLDDWIRLCCTCHYKFDRGTRKI